MADSSSYDDATLQRRYAMAQALLMPQNRQPIRHWAEGLASLGDTATGMMMFNRADKERKENEEQGKRDLLAILNPQAAAASTAAPGAPAAPIASAPMGRLPGMSSRVYDQSEFNPIDAAVATPKELAAGVPAPPQYASLIGKAAVDNDLPPQLLAAQLKQESGFNPNAVSSAGATGISQFMPGTAREMGVNPLDPASAIPGGARYLRQNIDRFGGSVPLGLAAYNAGPGAVQRAGGDMSRLPTETQAYVPAIMGAAQNPVAAALTAPPPAAAPAASGGLLAGVPDDKRLQIAQMLTSKNPTVRAIGQAQIANITKADQPTDEIREYQFSQRDPGFKTYKTDLKKAGAIQNQVVLDQKTEGEFSKEAAKTQAKRFNEIAEEGPKAKQMVSDVETLRVLGDQIGTGKLAEAKATIGPYADALGIKVDKLSEIQAFEAIVNRVAPNLRVPGSGAQSDYELRNFLKSVPTLGNTAEGNALVAKTMQGLYENKIKAAEIAAQALNGDLKRSDADKQLRELPDPMKDWRESIKNKKEPTGAPAANADALKKKYGLD